MPRFLPTVFTNDQRRVALTPADLDNHPLAETYIAYLNGSRFPTDFHDWLAKREHRERSVAQRDKEYVAARANDPYCRSPLKTKAHKRTEPTMKDHLL